MAPLLDRQRQGVRLGSIRFGVKIVGANGKIRPAKLDTFALTSADKVKIDAAAALYGGTVEPWKPNDGAAQQWRVITTVDRLPVRVPPGNPVVQNYEMWAATRQRLCDGVTERMKGQPCVCPADLMMRKAAANNGSACKPVTRLSLILADLPGLGVWQLSSTGDSAADELAATAELLQRAELAGAMLPAVLRLEQRESRGSGELHKYPVPVLDVIASLQQLEAGDFTPAGALTTGSDRPALPAARPVVDHEPAPPVDRTPLPPPAPPVGAPKNPQSVIDLARATSDPEIVKRLGGLARDRGWMQEYVADTSNVEEPLENALWTELERCGGVG